MAKPSTHVDGDGSAEGAPCGNGGRDRRKDHTEPSREPLKAPSGQERDENIEERKVVKNVISFGFLLLRVGCDGKVVQESMA